jgi:hypothetical protein
LIGARRRLSLLLVSGGLLAVLAVILGSGFARAQVEVPPAESLLKQIAPGLLARTIYTAVPTGPYRVEIWELVVGPGRRSEATSLPGGVVLEVRSGNGIITVGERHHKVTNGSTLSVAEGSAFAIQNTNEESALSLRAVVISAPSQ